MVTWAELPVAPETKVENGERLPEGPFSKMMSTGELSPDQLRVKVWPEERLG